MSITAVQIITTTLSPPGLPHAFLSKPPPPKNRRRFATTPAPTESTTGVRRCRSNSTISSWVSRVQPGSPAPVSPEQRRSPRRGSISRRYISPSPVSGSFLTFIDTPSGTSHHICTPTTARTPECKDTDLLVHGYTSVFVHLPIPPSPAPPAHSSRASPTKRTLPKRPTLSHFRSLSSLHMRSRSPSSPTRPLIAQPGKVPKSQQSVRPPTLVPRPLPSPFATKKSGRSYDRVVKRNAERFGGSSGIPLEADVALMTMFDGGKHDDNVQKAMRERAARRQGRSKRSENLVVDAAHRDDNGNYHYDEECTWEFRPLISPNSPGNGSAASPTGRAEWVQMEDMERRGSAASVMSDESTTVDPEELAAFGRAHTSGVARPARSSSRSTSAPPSKSRRRKPAPLNISSSYASSPAPVAAHKHLAPPPPHSARADFLASSFAPPTPAPPMPAPPLSATHASSPYSSTDGSTEFGLVTSTGRRSNARRFTLTSSSKTNVSITVLESPVEEMPVPAKTAMKGMKSFLKSVSGRR